MTPKRNAPSNGSDPESQHRMHVQETSKAIAEASSARWVPASIVEATTDAILCRGAHEPQERPDDAERAALPVSRARPPVGREQAPAGPQRPGQRQDQRPGADGTRRDRLPGHLRPRGRSGPDQSKRGDVPGGHLRPRPASCGRSPWRPLTPGATRTTRTPSWP